MRFGAYEKKPLCMLGIYMCFSCPTRLSRAVGNVSGNRCESDCRSRGPEFDPCPVPYFRGDYEIISTVILLPSADSFKKNCCQLQAKVCAGSTG